MNDQDSARARKVVVIDDDSAWIDLVTFALTNSKKISKPMKGIEVQRALDGPEGLELLTKSKPDLILLDDMMPEWDGLEVLRRLKADPDLRRIPVIMMTTRADDIMPRYLEAGAADVLFKLCAPRDLTEKVYKGLGLGNQAGAL